MKRFVRLKVGRNSASCRSQWTTSVSEDNPVRVVDVFVDELDLATLGFEGVDPERRETLHGATIEARSRGLECGSEFLIYLPSIIITATRDVDTDTSEAARSASSPSRAVSTANSSERCSAK